MKTHIRPLVLALVAILSATTQAADTPAAILADYRAKAEPAIQKVNDTLEKAVVPILAELVKSGDTTGADKIKEQLKAKQDGEPVAHPHAKVAALFPLYDAARVKAASPARTSAITRIESLLKTSEGKKLEVVAEAAAVREEIETGARAPVAPKIPIEWTYHSTLEQKVAMAAVKFHADGTFEMSGTPPGKWKANKKGNEIKITFADRSEWTVKINTDAGNASIERPDISGVRYLKIASK